MTKQEFDEMAALVVRLRKDVELHMEALKQSNAQCGEYLLHNEMLAADRATLHKELVEVRAALAAVSAERDSLKRTLQEWEDAETKPQQRIPQVGFIQDDDAYFGVKLSVYGNDKKRTRKPAADDIADHVVPPVLPMCTTCHECGGVLRPSRAAGSHSVLCCRTERCSRINTAWQDDVSPYHGPCKSAAPVRHE